MNADWIRVMQIVLLCAVGAMCAVTIPWLKERLGAEKLKALWKWVCIAVQAAEQIFGAGKGERKKEYALDVLEAQGVKADGETLDVLIEAAVRELT